MGLLKCIMVSIIALLINLSPVLAQEATGPNADYIYLLDISGSMNRQGLFNNIKARLKELVEERTAGDRLIIGTFGENVWWPVQIDVRDPGDIKDIKKIIDDLKADENWTWMSRALEETKEKSQDIKTRSPGKNLMIYMLSDCLNNPPPEIKKSEPPWTFLEVVLNYFEDCQMSDTFIYLLSYRPLQPQEKAQILGKTPIIPIEPQVPLPLPRIRVSGTGFDFARIDLSRGEATHSGQLTIADILDVQPGKPIHLTCPSPFKVNPGQVTCKKIGQEEPIHITIPAHFQPGEYTEKIHLSAPGTAVEPPQLSFSFIIPEPSKTGAINNIIKLLFLLLVIVLLFVLYDAFLREKSIWIENIAEDRTGEAKLKGWHKTYLGEKSRDKYIDFRLPNYYIQRERFKNSALSVEPGEQQVKIKDGQDVQCRDLEGNEVILRFYREKPLETKPEEGEEENGLSGPLDDVFGKK